MSDSMTVETWLPIPGFPDYEVSNLGRVRSWKTGHPRLLKLQTAQRGGYQQFMPSVSGVRCLRKVHIVAMLAFVGPCPDGLEVRHLNGDPADNRISNLRYGTHRENVQDTIRAGRQNNMKKTHCPQGHEYSAENTRYGSNGARFCRQCSSDYYQKHSEVLAAAARARRARKKLTSV